MKVKIIRDPPPLLAAAAGDAVTNLRSALDFLACQLAIQNGANDLAGVEFPFADSPEKFVLGATQKKIQKLSSDAADLIRGQQPYKGGNDLLWALNALRKPNIHRHLIVSVLEINRVGGRLTINAGAGYHTVEQPPPWLPSDREITVITFTPGTELEYNLQVGMSITVRDIEPIEGQSIVTVLQQMAGLTERILLTFEGRFF